MSQQPSAPFNNEIDSDQSQPPPYSNFDKSGYTAASTPAYPTQTGYPNQPPYPTQQFGYPTQSNQMQQGTYPNLNGQQTIIIQQPIASPYMNMMRDVPVNIRCSQCGNDVRTNLEYETGTLTWISCAVTFFVGCYLGCCLIPFFIRACKDVVHKCPTCNTTLGRYNRV